MRIKKVLPKKKVKVVIPADLLEFLKNSYELIKMKDPSTLVVSDDRIQEEVGCGGLIEKGGDTYVFTYFPTKDSRKGVWDMTFNMAELQEIVDGKKVYLDLWACQTVGCQSKFMKENGVCFRCDYFDDGSEMRAPAINWDRIAELRKQKELEKKAKKK